MAKAASKAASTIPACLGNMIASYSTPLNAVYRRKPISPGHVIICPRQTGASRLSELPMATYFDLFATVHRFLARVGSSDKSSNSECFNVCIKDGKGAGGPFPHVHLHIIPRRIGDFEPDAIYPLIDAWHPEGGKTNHPPKLEFPHDSERKPRTNAVMTAEARRYHELAISAATVATPSSTSTSHPIVRKLSPQRFGRIPISADHTFLCSGLTYAFVNLKPLVPGHVLISPKRVVQRLHELSAAEQQDLWRHVLTVQAIVGRAHSTDDFIVAVQDGKLAGQSIPHVHVHILPIPKAKDMGSVEPTQQERP